MPIANIFHSPPHGDNHRSYPYMAFSSDAEWQVAKAKFMAKYGQEPEYIFTDGPLLLVGPVPSQGEDKIAVS